NSVMDCLKLIVAFLKFGAAWPGEISTKPWINTLYDIYKIGYRILYVAMGSGVLLYCIFAYETLEDLIENISVLTTQFSISARFYVLVVYKNEILSLIKNVDRNFYVPGEKEKRIVESTVKLSNRVGSGIFILYVVTTIAMVLYPMTSKDRILPFKSWYPYVNLSESPYYELEYAGQASLIIVIGWFAGAMDAFCMSLLLYCGLQYKLVARGLMKSQNITELRICIQYHQAAIEYVNETCNALNPIFIVQVLLENVLICLLGFQATTMDSHGVKIVRVILHLSCCIFQIGFMCFFGQHITTESAAVYEAAYESPWYQQSPKFRRMIWMVVERARKPAALSGGLFGDISLPLFYAVMRSSYSYITMLSQFQED
ncbi:hypothetical protein L9F63_012441, partial [Diploptera punctata]